MGSWVLLLMGLAVCFLAAAWLRMQTNLYRQAYVVSSPLSEAMRQLVGMAGGIYLSLVMFTSFLGMTLPDHIQLGHVMLDPLAVLAMMLACAQPLVLLALRRIQSGKGR